MRRRILLTSSGGGDREYLTFIATESGTFKFVGNSISYSLNSGITWASLASNTNTPTVNAGDKIMWKATLKPTSSIGIGTFSSTSNFTVEGNVMSLLYGDNAVGKTSLSGKNYAFYKLFNDCSKLTSAEDLSLPATTLGTSCYQYMFKGCTSLTTAPELPATTLELYCYQSMFEGCTSLTAAPELPATKLSYGCYQYMFKGCTSLTAAPELPATKLSYGCYKYMFYGCTSLTTAPELPATTSAISCYQYMFYGCTSLTAAPELPATTLELYCYQSMFEGCTKLTTAPVLPATTLTNECYQSMFKGCTKLNSITCYAINIGAIDCTTDWVSGVASRGTFVGNKYTGWTINSTSGVPTNWTATYVDVQETTFNPKKSLSPSGYVTLTASGDSLLGLGRKSSVYTVYISKNRSKWQAINVDEYFKMSNGDIYYVCGLLSNNNSSSNYTQFTIKGSVNSSGNCNAIWSYKNLNASLKDYCGYYMFCGCTGLTTAPELPATTLGTYGYHSMFLGCTSLTTAPELPATTLATSCYNSMFEGCTSLTAAPELPTTNFNGKSNCYEQMFKGCTSLTTAPSELPATTLATQCYQSMFLGCTSLTTAPELPATTMTDGCYQSMFEGCTSLTAAPSELPATTLASQCYGYMFQGCTSLTTAPVLPATTLASECYRYMFYKCTSLNYIKAMFTTTPSSTYMSNWVKYVASSGTFVKNSAATWTSSCGISTYPCNWTVQTASS